MVKGSAIRIFFFFSLDRYVLLCYPGRTLTLLAACGSKRVLALGARGGDLARLPATAEDLAGFALRWLG